MRSAVDLVSLGSQLIKVNVTVVDAFFLSAFCFLLLFLSLSLCLFFARFPIHSRIQKSAQRTDLAASRTKERGIANIESSL